MAEAEVVPTPPSGAGGPYSRKYVKVPVETLRHVIIPECADECARKRAYYAWTPAQYRRCLAECIKRKIRELHQRG